MLFEELLQDELEKGEKKGEKKGVKKGRRKDIIYLLSDLGEVPETLVTRIKSENSKKRLKSMLKLAAKAESIEMFSEKLEKLNV